MSASTAKPESVKEVHDFLANEIQRIGKHLSHGEWPTILVGVGDLGEISASPCRLLLPFHYPATVDDLDKRSPDHFDFPQKWKSPWKKIPEFVEQHEIFSSLEDKAESILASEQHKQTRIAVLQDACAAFESSLTIFGIESDTETWWEVNTFHISGPRIPAPPAPVSDAQILGRLCRHTHSYVGKSRFEIEDGVITEVDFDGADTTDATIDLLRGVPNLKDLLRGLKRMSLKHTLVTERSLKFLERDLPNVVIEYSHYLK